MGENNGFEFGSRTTSIHTERKVKQFAIFETELNTISYLNTATTLFVTFAVIFFEGFIQNFSKNIPDYLWFSDKSLWMGIVLLIIAIAGFVLNKNIISDIKKQSKVIIN